MKNRILSVTFNPESFPIAPKLGATVVELDHHVICMAQPLRRTPEDFTTILDPIREEACVACLDVYKTNDVRLDVRFADNDLNVAFDVINGQGERELTLLAQGMSYYLDISTYLNENPDMEESRERELRIHSMKSLFSQNINGTDAFWLKLQTQFMNALAPLRLDAERSDENNFIIKDIVPMAPRPLSSFQRTYGSHSLQ